MANELVDAFGRASRADAVRAVIVTGAGRAFCAGMDLTTENNTPPQFTSRASELPAFYEAWVWGRNRSG